MAQSGQEIYINPAKGRRFNVDDFAGLLARYDSDIKTIYPTVNSDIQYPVTVSRAKLKNAFTSWANLNEYIDEYKLTKNLVADAYRSNSIQIQTVSAVSDESTGKAFVKALRNAYLDFQEPTDQNNAWAKVGGYGNAVITWSNPEDIVLLIRNDVLTNISVDVLAAAFNMSEADFLASKVIGVDNFSKYAADGTQDFDGSAILALIADKSWFRIKEQDFEMDEFYNANNRTWQMYLNVVKMYNYSVFANAKIIATSAPTVNPTTITMPSTATVVEDGTVEIPVVTDPFQANAAITYSSSAEGKATVAAKTGNNKIAVVTGVDDGSATITATCGTVTATCTVTVTAKT